MIRLFVDGGVIGHNPSVDGGTWAWVQVATSYDDHIEQGSGIVLPGNGNPPEITNNFTEFAAMVMGLESLPVDVPTHVYSDSQITLGRFFKSWKITNIPLPWIKRGMQARARLSIAPRWTLLDGHPTEAQLLKGQGKRGAPVSRHNVWCDEECQRLAKEWRANNP